MFKSLSRKKLTTSDHHHHQQRFKDYYAEWITVLETKHLPNLRHHMSSTSSTPNLLSAHVEIMHHHFKTYYQALDNAATNDVSQIIFPYDIRTPMELPFLWLGDLHPYLFTNLLRSYLIQHDDSLSQDEDQENEQENEAMHGDDDEEEIIEVGQSCEFLKKQWPLMNAWKIHSRKLTTRIDQIERGLRLMVPALMNRVRKAQLGFVHKVGSGKVTAAVAAAEMEEEMVGIVMDANRLRKDVISEIVSFTNVYQGALFLEGLAQFLVGFRDGKLLNEFKNCKSRIN
ncbi:DOG1 domain-containing protein [Artemisia annua]|uniref:DOG1 domain-containing protein n=1 Tax=Artemisia annua TaxID=35608 RepID=A0A2U1MXC7_ARTAN|nr:DOG1 domain-containing protein [Artemisia annua]